MAIIKECEICGRLTHNRCRFCPDHKKEVDKHYENFKIADHEKAVNLTKLHYHGERALIKETKKMKRKDLKNCVLCKKGLAHDKNMTFYEFDIKQHILDIKVINQEHGLEQYFGGGSQGATLAAVMGTDPDLTKKMNYKKVFICLLCVTERSIGELIEAEYE